MFEAKLGIPWGSLPTYCFLESFKEMGGNHACLVRVNALTSRNGRLLHLVDASRGDQNGLPNVLAEPGAGTSRLPRSQPHLSVVETPVCPLYRVLSSTSCFLISEAVRGDRLEWEVIGESKSVVLELARKLNRSGVAATVDSMERINGGRRLTNRQEQVLRQAFERGFFENPHKTSVRQLASALDCSPSTMVRLLRKAERKVLAERLE